jgi:hypothetical protein
VVHVRLKEGRFAFSREHADRELLRKRGGIVASHDQPEAARIFSLEPNYLAVPSTQRRGFPTLPPTQVPQHGNSDPTLDRPSFWQVKPSFIDPYAHHPCDTKTGEGRIPVSGAEDQNDAVTTGYPIETSCPG